MAVAHQGPKRDSFVEGNEGRLEEADQQPRHEAIDRHMRLYSNWFVE